jgi:hypothetical protein
MSFRFRIAFCLYALVSAGLIAAGLWYISWPQIMPYHLQVINRSWTDLDPRLQMMFLDLLKLAGFGMLGIGLAIGILTLIPARRGQKWAHRAIPVIGLFYWAPVTYLAYSLHHATGASTPWQPAVINVLFLLTAYFLAAKPVEKAGQRREGKKAVG